MRCVPNGRHWQPAKISYIIKFGPCLASVAFGYLLASWGYWDWRAAMGGRRLWFQDTTTGRTFSLATHGRLNEIPTIVTIRTAGFTNYTEIYARQYYK